jgi:UDP-N-acetylmuramate--alanine ligase
MIFEGKHIQSIYFLGLGGIGMSALARYFHLHGVDIAGYDRLATQLTYELAAEGMEIHSEDNPDAIPSFTDMVIYTPAIPKNLNEFIRIRKMGIPVYKRAEVIGKISKDHFTIAIAGTHGKTTITSMIAHILKKAGKSMFAFLGGISKNYESNFITSGKQDIMVVEADEFDRSFLQLHPDIAVISSLDADHLDIYESREGMLESFSQFANQVKPGGKVITKAGLENELPAVPGFINYTIDSWADFSLRDLTVYEGKYRFTIIGMGQQLKDIILPVPGRHNVENALAATAVCNFCKVSASDILSGLNSYQGVKRRFDIRLDKPGKLFIDDYAHHPEELTAFIQSVKELYPGKRVTGVFQPHLYSRTQDFAEGFARSLDLLDEAILLDIYPAREKPIQGVTSRLILDLMKNKNKNLVKKDKLISVLEIKRPELLLTMGAGDIDQLVEPIESQMETW